MTGDSDPIDHFLHNTRAPLVHIGYPKALSSWLQFNLFRRENGLPTAVGPLMAMLGLIDPPPFAPPREGLYEHFRKLGKTPRRYAGQTPVITGENLAGNTFCGGYDGLTIAERLRACFPQARVLIVVREQQKMLRSLYTSFIRLGGMPHSPARLLEPTNPRSSVQLGFSYLRYDALVQGYQALFGAEQVLVLPAELFYENPRDFLRQIIEHADPPEEIDIDKLPVTERSNPGSRLLTLYILRRCNSLFVRNTANPRGLLRDDEIKRQQQRVRLARRLDRLLPETRLDNWLEQRFSKLMQEAAGDHFTTSNRKLAELTGLDLARYGYRL